MGKELLYEVEEHVAFLTINREERRNALSRDMITAFLEYFNAIEHDEEVRAVCITGAGEKTFCSGADLATTLGGNTEDTSSGARNYAELLKVMARCGKPSVARVNGPCLAGGIGVMLSCDIVIARNDVFFCTPEVNVGVFPMMVGALLFRNVNRKKLMDMVLTGRKILVPEAENIGLITRSVEPNRLDDEIQKTLKILTSKSPIGIRIGKEAFRAIDTMLFERAVDYLCEALEKVISTADAKEGMLAFIEKREPTFKGR
jgi:enoyl-CoA hydratase/carnithine racemase